MNDSELLDDIQADLQRGQARQIIYLEGESDPEAFLALLGVATPGSLAPGDPSYVHQDTMVRGLPEQRGSGAKAVARRADLARRSGFPGVWGITDGDGRSWADLALQFDAPHPGPLFSWKAYCIEDLLAVAGWPTIWPTLPDWAAALDPYAPFVAMNGLHRMLQGSLEALGLHRYTNPSSPLRSEADFRRALQAGRAGIEAVDIEAEFDAGLTRFRQALATDLREAHCQLNGRWLLSHLGPDRTGNTPDQCRSEWQNHVRSLGGLPEVRDLWRRITGRDP